MHRQPSAQRGVFVAVAAVMVAAMLLSSSVMAAPRKGPKPSPTPTPPPATLTPIQVYGAWHCSDDYCTWGTVRDPAEFDSQNHWLIDRDPDPAVTGAPSVNLVVLSFVNPLRLLHQTTDATTLNGVPRGMTSDIVGYFASRGITVMLSIGGITYVDDWNAALAEDAAQLGRNAAALATQLNVGIEIDYEENRSPDLIGLETFIREYRKVHAYAPSSADPRARLTLDTAAGDRWLIGINRKATEAWLGTSGQNPAVALDWANAMVPARQPSVSGAIANWQEHVDGKPQYDPPVLPLAPARFTGGLYVAEGNQARAECNDFDASLQKATATFVRSVAPSAGFGTTPGMLGFMFWAAEKPSTRGVGTQPPNSCEGGIGAGATAFDIPLPLPSIRAS